MKPINFRNLNFFRRLFAACSVAVVSVSCMSGGDYKTGEIDMSMDVAPGGLRIPLVVVDKIFIKDYLDKQIAKIDNDRMEIGPDNLRGGTYTFRYTGEEIRKSMAGFTQNVIDLQTGINGSLSPIEVDTTGSMADMDEVDLPASTMAFDLGLPDFDFAGNTAAEEIAPENPTNQWPAGLNYLKGQTLTQAYINTMTGLGQNPITDAPKLESADITKREMVIDVDLPAEISRINSVTLTDKQNSSSGTLITMSVDLGGLQPVNGGAIIRSLVVTLPKRYTLATHPSYPAALSAGTGGTHQNILTATDLDMGTNKTIDFKFYVVSVDLSDLVPAPSNEPGMNFISTLDGGQGDEELGFEIMYELSLKPGTISSNPVAPSVKIAGQPVFKDATFETNEITQSFATEFALEQFKFEGIPSNISKIDKIAFVDGSNSMTLSMSELPLPFSDDPILDLKFPDIFVFADSHTAPEFTSATNTFHLTTAQLEAGYEIEIASINFGAGQGIPDSQGALDFSDYGNVEVSLDHTFAPATLTYSTDIATLPDGDVSVSVAAATLEVDLAASDLNISSVGDLSKPVHIAMSIDQNLPDLPEDVDVSSIASITIVPTDGGGEILDGQDVELTLAIDITDPLLNEFYMDNVRIAFPAFVDLEARPDIKNNVYTKSRIVVDATQSSQTLETFVIKGFKNIAVTNGKAELDGELTVDFRINAPDNSSLNLGANMEITPQVTIPGMKVKRITGEFGIPLGEYLDADNIEPVDLSNVFEFLGEDSAIIPGLASPIIKVEFDNPTGIITSGTVMLTPRNKEGIAILPGSGVFAITIPLKGGMNKLHITKNGSQNAPAGYTGIDADFTQLMRQIPHTIDVTFGGGAGEPGSYIDLSEDDYEFVVNYSIETPLAFDGTMNYAYDVDEGGLNEVFSNLDGLGVRVSEVMICAEFESNFPFKISGSTVRFYNTDGEESGVNANIDKIFEGPLPSGGNKTSTMVISLVVPDGGDLNALAKIDRVRVSLPLESTASGGAYSSINENSYIKGRVWLSLPEGVNYEL